MVLDGRQIQDILQVVRSASKEILSIYNKSELAVQMKSDETPLTEADTLSQQMLTGGLQRLFPDVPFVSEESQSIPFAQRKTWEYFWLIDPLDGTKEFIKRNGEFTINVALIHKHRPVFGVVCLPALDTLYFGQSKKGSFKINAGAAATPLRPQKSFPSKISVVRSRSHRDAEEEKLLSGFDDIEVSFAGSSLKFCYVAEAKAHLYLRSGPTMEWDTAAGQCVAESAGALMRRLDGGIFNYNKESLQNPGFACAANRQILDRLLKPVIAL